MRLWLVLTAFFGNTMGFDAHGATVTAEVFGTYTRAGLTKVNEAVSNDGSASTGFRDDTMQIVTGDPLVTASAAIAARASADFNNGIVRSAASMSVTDRFNGAPTARGTARLEDTISFTGLTGGQSVSGRLSVLGSQQFTGRGNASASFSFRLFRPTASLAVVNDA